ncbi:hypothetical protein D0962_30070 [Leptolyngbyaceae cyanobacterium CCMR0082]|uniref:Uncharacterized protein n=1 Tax=Adonisia turfae CCMR0082 TaxID=2304604 RepID=A0A6M0SG68_9CYAN|nr:hypothetical protein [Adonisia turfae]NEZ66953.1 hypothetical protein [Adonisia turfae CCMR0082]
MNKFDSTKLRTKFDNTSEGWLVQVYSGDRRLLCVLDASHGWSFLLGCGLGLLLSVTWINAARYSTPLEPTPPTELPALQID